MSGKAKLWIAGGVTLMLLASLIPMSMFVLLIGIARKSCDTTNNTDLTGGDSAAVSANYRGKGVAGLSAKQTKNAADVVAQGQAMGFSDKGIIIALATASQESHFTNYANDGRGGDLGPDQVGIAASLKLPHEAVGTDHGSVGIFQQQWPWWGTLKELMTPSTSAKKFYQALRKVRGYESLPVTVAAQRVQRSAFPEAYADDEPIARQLLAALRSGDTSTTPAAEQASDPLPKTVGSDTWNGEVALAGKLPAGTDENGCPQTVSFGTLAGGGVVVFPLPAGSYRNNHNWHTNSSIRSSWHTGNDYSAPCGTPVKAAHGGTIHIKTGSSWGWSGRWLVQVSLGPGKLTTWYAHMQKLYVRDGQTVAAGQRIGDVGSEGNSTGCHLHLEVHTKNGTIYGPDNTNPDVWFKQNLGKNLGGLGIARVAMGKSGSDADGGFRLVSFNILGSNHTSRGGNQHPTWATGPNRVRGMLATLSKWGTDVAALQEVQPNQRRRIVAATKGTFTVWPGRARSDNQVMWRNSAFRLVRTANVRIPYFNGRLTPMPAVLLEQRTTGKRAWFVSIHNPAETADYHNQGGHRTRATKIERTWALRQAGAGRPVFVLGDFNAKKQAFCIMTSGRRMHASAGGGPGCRLPGRPQIDWQFGTSGTSFAGYTIDRTPIRSKTSDHPAIITQAKIN